MEISYIGHSCFKVKGKNATLVFDPYNPEKFGAKLPKLEADIVLTSHDHFDHNFIEGVRGSEEGKEPFIISGPGEYDVKGVHVEGFKTFHDEKEGAERGLNTIYYVEIDGFFLLHLGDLGHELSKDILEEFGNVDVLMVPVGGFYTIDHEKAVDIISEIEPSFVIPMHYAGKGGKDLKIVGVDKFISEWGSEVVKKDSKLKLSSKSDLPEETQVVVLDQG